MRLSKTKRREMRFITIPPKKTKDEIRKARNKRKGVVYSTDIQFVYSKVNPKKQNDMRRPRIGQIGSKGHHDGNSFTGMNLGIYRKWGS